MASMCSSLALATAWFTAAGKQVFEHLAIAVGDELRIDPARRTSPRPLTSTSTMPPPAEPVTRFASAPRRRLHAPAQLRLLPHEVARLPSPLNISIPFVASVRETAESRRST